MTRSGRPHSAEFWLHDFLQYSTWKLVNRQEKFEPELDCYNWLRNPKEDILCSRESQESKSSNKNKWRSTSLNGTIDSKSIPTGPTWLTTISNITCGENSEMWTIPKCLFFDTLPTKIGGHLLFQNWNWFRTGFESNNRDIRLGTCYSPQIFQPSVLAWMGEIQIASNPKLWM